MEESSARQRAKRFQIQTALRYRAVGDDGWYEGQTDNISESGILFQTSHLVPANTRIEMRLVLPVTIEGAPAPEIVCRGRVVRADPPNAKRTAAALAATISVYRFRRDVVPNPTA